MKYDYEVDGVGFSHYIIKNPTNEIYMKHMHNTYEILLFISGDCDYVIEYKTYKLKPYDLLLIPPGTYHYTSVKSNKTDYERYVINFKKNSFNTNSIDRMFQKLACINAKENPCIINAFNDGELILNNENNQKSSLIIDHVVNDILLKIDSIADYQNVMYIETKTLFSNIILYINDHLREKITIDSLSKTFYISKSNLSYLFLKNLGISPMKYIRQNRLFLAKALIEEGNKSTEIAIFCGFENYNTFVRAFEKTFGQTPTSFKKIKQ